VTTIPKDKFKHFAAKLVKEWSSKYSENKIDLIVRLNRKVSGWANCSEDHWQKGHLELAFSGKGRTGRYLYGFSAWAAAASL
jgi:hypothetical protein